MKQLLALNRAELEGEILPSVYFKCFEGSWSIQIKILKSEQQKNLASGLTR